MQGKCQEHARSMQAALRTSKEHTGNIHMQGTCNEQKQCTGQDNTKHTCMEHAWKRPNSLHMFYARSICKELNGDMHPTPKEHARNIH